MRNFSISKLAETILAQRKALNLTQQELADKAGINRSMLCRLENQDYVPSMDQLTRLANTLQFDVTDVFIEYSRPVFHRVVPEQGSVYTSGFKDLQALPDGLHTHGGPSRGEWNGNAAVRVERTQLDKAVGSVRGYITDICIRIFFENIILTASFGFDYNHLCVN